ncbi:hypothetical protein Vafri_2012 [Volvox africanus]|nr:hypothetical protein Vafri_2012 [Volvox africanus]
MQEEVFRTAFTFAPLLRHRTSDAARRITAVSLDTAAGRIFVGLASGHVEEHEILVKQAYDTAQHGSGAHATTRLVAEKRVSKQAITSLSCLPTAARLAILCEDGTASTAAYDTWSLSALQGVRSAVAMAVDPGPAAAAAAARRPMDLVSGTTTTTATTKGVRAGSTAPPTKPPPRPVRLAIAVRSIATVAKILIYSIAPSVGVAASQPPAHALVQIPVQDPVQELTWVGPGLFVQHAMSYSLLQPGGRLTQIAEHGCSQPCMASGPGPGGPAAGGNGSGTSTGPVAVKMAAAAARGALLFQDSLILQTDGNGVAVVGSEPITVSEPPLALCSSAGFLVVVSDAEGVLVYDTASARLIQRIFWAHDDPWIAAAKRIPVTEDAAGSGGVAVATSSVVMLLRPVAPDVQARELLKRKRFDAALALIRSCRRAGEAWADTALAQAGLLMLQELRCEDALAALEEVGVAEFQPAQLLPLFPRICRRWLPALPHRSYWGLHGSLQSLDRICDDFLELRNSTSSSPRPSPSPPASLRSGTGTIGVVAADTAAAAARLLMMPSATSETSLHGHRSSKLNQQQHHVHHHHRNHLLPHHFHHHHQQQHSRGSSTVAVIGDGGLSPVVSMAGVGGGEVAALAADAKRHIISYLLRTRGRQGVVCLEGIDVLLVHLLVDVCETATLEVFLDNRNDGEYSVDGGTASASIGGGGIDGGGGVDADRLSSAMSLPILASGSSAGEAAIGSNAGRAGDSRDGNGISIPCSLIALGATGPPACVSPRDAALVAALEGAGRWHALAILRAVRGQVPQALELWQRLALGEVAESLSASGAVAAKVAAAAPPAAASHVEDTPSTGPSPPSRRASISGAASRGGGGDGGGDMAHPHGNDWATATTAVAAAAAATLMARPTRTPPLLCLSKLPWLLQAAPDLAIHVLRSRSLPVADVMSLLQGRYDGVRWQYLHHLVYGSGATTASTVRTSPAAAESSNSAVAEESFPPQPSEPTGVVGAEAMATSEMVAWQLDPALHTELALELIESIGLLHTRTRQQHHREGQPDSPGRQMLMDERDPGAAVPSRNAVVSASTAPTEAVTIVEPPAELPPALPLLPPHAARHASPGHDGAAAAAALRSCSPPPMSSGAVGRRLSPVPPTQPHMPRAPGNPQQQQTHPPPHLQQSQHHQQQQQRGLDRQRVVSHVAQSHTSQILSPVPSRPSPGPVGADRSGREGAVLVPYASGGVHYGPGGPGVSGAAAAAAAAAATAASSVDTAELPWLGTLGVLPAAAVARQFVLAVHAVRVAAGQDFAPEPQLEVDAAAYAFDGVGGLGDSLSLLRALSHKGDGVGMGTLVGLRAVLQHHLYCSKLYDASIVLQAIVSGGDGDGDGGGVGGGQATPPLLREQVQLHSRLGNHPAALAVLALQLHDVDSAICYCRARCGQEGWLALLDLLLR